MTIVAIADTHSVIWEIFDDKRLSITAKTFIDTTAAKGDEIGVSVISLVEIVYLIERGKIPVETFSRVVEQFESTDSAFITVDLDIKIARALSSIDIYKVPDMPDRIIAATAFSLKVPLISRDAKIQTSGLHTIW